MTCRTYRMPRYFLPLDLGYDQSTGNMERAREKGALKVVNDLVRRGC